mgnify:FL=1|tara:strand:- start:9719 stop:10042 length:324 start_codon:yes stop_codon:yes gene_type:complete
MKYSARTTVLASLLAVAVGLTSCSSPEDDRTVAQAETPADPYADQVGKDFEWVEEGEFDHASIPVLDGVVWYGTWEAAMAEQERTGKPVMLHMGSPRCRNTCVPGAW